MRVLFLDDDPQRHEGFKKLSVGHSVDHVTTAEEAIEALRHNKYDLACLDHDLGGRTFVDSSESNSGYAVAEYISGMVSGRPESVIVHSFNPAGADRIAGRLASAGVKVVKAPYGTWHLLGH